MALADVDEQILAVREVGDVEPTTGDPVQPTDQGTGIVLGSISRLFAKYAGLATVSPALRDLYVRRDAVSLVIAVLEMQVDVSNDQNRVNLRLSQRVATRLRQRATFQTEIERIEKRLAVSGAPATGRLTTKVPIDPPPPGSLPQDEQYRPDANSPVYTGSPYWPNRTNS